MKKIVVLLAIFVAQVQAGESPQLPTPADNKAKLMKSKSSPLGRIFEEEKMSPRTQEMNGEGQYLNKMRRNSVFNVKVK